MMPSGSSLYKGSIIQSPVFLSIVYPFSHSKQVGKAYFKPRLKHWRQLPGQSLQVHIINWGEIAAGMKGLSVLRPKFDSI